MCGEVTVTDDRLRDRLKKLGERDINYTIRNADGWIEREL